MPARPGPRPSGRVNAVKTLLDDEEYGDLQVFKAVNGISSDSEALALAFRRFSRGAIGSMPDLSRICCPSASINSHEKGVQRAA